MVDAGRGEALRKRKPGDDLEIRAAADDYLQMAHGDAAAALVLAVADGMAVSSHVSRGFVRWGQPRRRVLTAGVTSPSGRPL